jgi:hypothetical protein
MLFQQLGLRVLSLFGERVTLFGQPLNVFLESVHPVELTYVRSAICHLIAAPLDF